ncbi:glycosyltransferase family 4 protein [Qipengyuania flava]|uniref:glycosyltransferase family 4 protein n=1 Tax=Qipengyuania flava TaxID=192812 RepID=UPI001C6306EB|nr:glycosyltransferase family 4 protein [Qipengyuania flava]QYJ06443.1 glycosyltransferase family 4 protein [Qipengyuania flava]
MSEADETGQRASETFVCVFNRDRDSYQVPLALHEAGMLEALVTDYYAPDKASSRLPGFLRRKQHPNLPRKRAVADRLAFAVQYAALALRFPMGPVWRFVGRRLGERAAKLAQAREAHLYCYHHYLPAQVDERAALVTFVFHPLPQRYLPALREDAEAYPEARRSFEEEQSREPAFHPPIPWDRMDAIVCASQVTADTLEAEGVDPEKLAVIPYGTPNTERVQQVERREGGCRFLFVGQGVQRKGLHHLIRAWQSAPRGDAELTIVSYACDPDIAAMITDPSIRLLGYQEREALAELFAQSDVFAMPSMVEGFGLVYLEALAHGCHVLGTRQTGLPDLDLNEASATPVEAGDVDALGVALDALIERANGEGFDRAAIAEQANRWTEADFRAAIADHALRVLSAKRGQGAYPTAYRAGPGRRG